MEISNKIIRKFSPCYDPASVGIPDGEVLSVKDWVGKYHKVVNSESDVIWLLTRNEFMSDKALRLFAVWCAREALKLIENPDVRSVEACNVAERFANGEATEEELSSAATAAARYAATATATARYAAMSAATARYAAESAARYAARYAAESAATARYAAESAAESAATARYAAESAARYAAAAAQVDQLLAYFE